MSDYCSKNAVNISWFMGWWISCWFLYTWDGINSQTAMQKSTCFLSKHTHTKKKEKRKKRHILDLLIKPQRLPCFKSKALFRLQEGVELHRPWGFFSGLKREAKMTNMSDMNSVRIFENTVELRGMILLSDVAVRCSSRTFAKAFWENSGKLSFHLEICCSLFVSCADSGACRSHAWREE